MMDEEIKHYADNPDDIPKPSDQDILKKKMENMSCDDCDSSRMFINNGVFICANYGQHHE